MQRGRVLSGRSDRFTLAAGAGALPVWIGDRASLARQRTTTPRIPDDARVQRSLDAMRAAFLELVSTRPLEEISIKEICDTAGLSYPTFYRRFASKEELLNGIATEEVRRLLASGLSARTHRTDGGSASAMCAYIEAQRPLWRTLLTGGAATAMRQEFMRLSREFTDTQPRINPWLPIDLAVPFVAGGIFEILAWWMKQRDDYPTSNVVKLMDALIIDTTARSRNIDLLP